MALSAARANYEFKGHARGLKIQAKASTTFWKGALIVIDGGYAGLPTDAANKIPIGIYSGQQNDTGVDKYVAPSSSMAEIEILTGKIWVPFSGAAQTDVGLLFFLSADDTVTKTAGSKTWKVPCEGFKTGHVLLNFDKLLGAAA